MSFLSNLINPVSLLVLSLLILPIAAKPLNIVQWIDDTLPHRGSTLRDELKCYALPYGGIGFASHIITYYTVIMLSAGRSPWLWKKNTHWRFDTFLSITGLLLTLSTTIFTMIRCRQRWEFVVLACWKMTMSLTLSAISTHAAIIVRRQIAWKNSTESRPGPPAREVDESRSKLADSLPSSAKSSRVWGWVVIYGLGILVGYSGLFSLVRQSWHLHVVRDITIGYIAITAAIILFGMLVGADSNGTEDNPGVVPMTLSIFIIGTGMIAALYSDWILAAIEGNYAGVPDGNNAVLYWIYFGAKRLPFASC